MGSRVLFFIFLVKLSSATRDALFNSLQGARVTNVYKKVAISDLSKIFCTQLCVLAASFNGKTLSCDLSLYHPADIASHFVEESGWILMYKANGLKDNWTVVFRGTANVGIDVDTSFVGKNNLPVPDAGCYSRETTACNTHVRSSWIDDWKELNIKEVKGEMLTGGETVAFVTFKNRETDDKISWYNSENILNSSWTDLPSGTAGYAISALERANKDKARSFRVIHSWSTNCNGEGWMFVSEVTRTRACSYESFSNYPVFIYITTSTKHAWKLSLVTADVMMISIKA